MVTIHLHPTPECSEWSQFVFCEDGGKKQQSTVTTTKSKNTAPWEGKEILRQRGLSISLPWTTFTGVVMAHWLHYHKTGKTRLHGTVHGKHYHKGTSNQDGLTTQSATCETAHLQFPYLFSTSSWSFTNEKTQLIRAVIEGL